MVWSCCRKPVTALSLGGPCILQTTRSFQHLSFSFEQKFFPLPPHLKDPYSENFASGNGCVVLQSFLGDAGSIDGTPKIFKTSRFQPSYRNVITTRHNRTDNDRPSFWYVPRAIQTIYLLVVFSSSSSHVIIQPGCCENAFFKASFQELISPTPTWVVGGF